MKLFLRAIFLVYLILFLSPAPDGLAAGEDGFAFTRQTKSRYFNIYMQEGVDTERLAMKIAVPSGAKSILHSSTASFSDVKLEDQIDLLYLVVSEILDTRMREFESAVKVTPGAEGLSEVAGRLFGQPIKAGGFYVVGLDSLYVDADNVTVHILGHEMAHAVISKYFAVPPPETIQEVLAGYVEYQLRKYR